MRDGFLTGLKIHSVRESIRHSFGFSDGRQRWNTLKNILERKSGVVNLLSMPPVFHVEVTRRCNINCLMCLRDSVADADISEDLIPNIISLSRTAGEVKLFGYGEPLLSKHFYRLLKLLQCGRITFFTNGIILREKLFEDLFEHSGKTVASVTFSIDGATAKTNDYIRKGTKFETVVENLEDLDKFKIQHGLKYPRIEICFVAMRSNVEELPDLVALASEMGVYSIWVTHLVVWQEDYRKESLVYSPDLTKEIFERASSLARERKVFLQLPAVISAKEVAFGEETPVHFPNCYEPWRQPVINYNGDVMACCVAPELVMGNLREQSFEDIWNGENFLELRKTVNSNPRGVCARCDSRFRWGGMADAEEVFIRLRDAWR